MEEENQQIKSSVPPFAAFLLAIEISISDIKVVSTEKSQNSKMENRSKMGIKAATTYPSTKAPSPSKKPAHNLKLLESWNSHLD